jgi:hypothetical protein
VVYLFGGEEAEKSVYLSVGEVFVWVALSFKVFEGMAQEAGDGFVVEAEVVAVSSMRGIMLRLRRYFHVSGGTFHPASWRKRSAMSTGIS